MVINPFKKIAISWILVMAAGSAISQFPPPDLKIVFAAWGILILAAVLATARAASLKNETYKEIWLGWTLLCFAVYAENVAAFYVPQLHFLLQFSFFFVWSIFIGFGYIFTAEKSKWPNMKMIGFLSILSSIIFFFPPLTAYQPAIFGVIQCLLFGYLAFK